MSSSDEINKHRTLNRAFLAGEKIPGIKFQYNSRITFICADDIRCEGWIVGVDPIDPEPVYTIERCDGGGDEEVTESKIEPLLGFYEKSAT